MRTRPTTSLRPVPLASGLVVVAATWAGPLPSMAPASFTAHMTMHVATVAVAAPLLAIGLAGSPLDVTQRGPAALTGLLSPIPLSLLELVVVWGWHAPVLHRVARSDGGWLAVEQSSFLAVGLLLWLASVGRPDADEPSRLGAGVVGLLFTSMHMTLLGALLGLAPRVLYPGLAPHHGALADQETGGAVMLLVGAASYLAGGLWLAARLLGSRLAEEARP